MSDRTSLSDTFYIEGGAQGFTIRPYGGTKVINISSTTAADLNTVEQASATNNARWDIYRYTGYQRWGYSLVSNKAYVAGNIPTITIRTWSTRIGYNTPHMSVASGYSSIATSTWNATNSACAVTLHDEGALQMLVKIGNPTLSAYDEIYYSTTVTLPLEEGIYFFKNNLNSKFMQLPTEQSTSINALTFDCINTNKWNVTHLGDGYYKITSLANGKVLTAPTALAEQITLATISEETEIPATQQWKITEVYGVDAYYVQPRSYSTGYLGLGYESTLVPTLSTFLVNGSENTTQWHLYPINEYAHITINTKIYYDSTVISEIRAMDGNGEKTNQEIEEIIKGYYYQAWEAIKGTFYIDINIISISHAGELDLNESCRDNISLNGICELGNCGSLLSAWAPLGECARRVL